jgi:hypothetical protein
MIRPAQKLAACSEGDIVILSFAGAEAVCGEKNVLVLTKRDLALHGSAEIPLPTSGHMQFRSTNGAGASVSAQQTFAAADIKHTERPRSAIVTYAVGRPDRPWNSYRMHSRAARNLGEYSSRRPAKTDSE